MYYICKCYILKAAMRNHYCLYYFYFYCNNMVDIQAVVAQEHKVVTVTRRLWVLLCDLLTQSFLKKNFYLSTTFIIDILLHWVYDSVSILSLGIQVVIVRSPLGGVLLLCINIFISSLYQGKNPTLSSAMERLNTWFPLSIVLCAWFSVKLNFSYVISEGGCEVILMPLMFLSLL